MNYDQISKKSALTLGNLELESIYQKFKNQLERLNGSGMLIVNRSIEGISTGLCDGIFFDIERLAEICMEDYLRQVESQAFGNLKFPPNADYDVIIHFKDGTKTFSN